MTPEPRRRLLAIDGLADGGLTATVATRSTVWLLRLALEHALSDLWRARGLSLDETSMRRQLLVLPRYASPEDTWRTTELWHLLSRAAHHHAYELVPTRSEILSGVQQSGGRPR